jgi:hypothetical protein
MGAWGYEALDSDQALDWLGNEIIDHAGVKIDKLLDKFEGTKVAKGADYAVDSYAYELRAAAFVMEKLNFFSNEHLYGDLFGRMHKALAEVWHSSWIDGWNDPETVRESVKAQAEAMKAGMEPTTLLDNLE